MSERVSVFGDDNDLDLTSFAPKSATDTKAPTPEKVRAVSETANFRSREPKAAKTAEPKGQQRRYRTGRNVQMSIKATQQARDAFNALCDQTGEPAGEILRLATAALRRELKI